MPEILAILAALGAATAWGVGQAFGKLALRGMTVSGYNLVREAVGAGAATILIGLTSGFAGLSQVPASTLLLAILSAVLGNICWLLLLFGTLRKHTLTGVIPYFHLAPAFIVAVNLLFGFERLTLPIVIGNVAIIVGVFLVAGVGGATWRPLAAGVVASAANGAWLVINRSCLDSGGMDAWELFFVQAVVSCLFFSVTGWRDAGFTRDRYHYICQALVSGLLARVLGMGLAFVALAGLPAVIVAPLLRLSLVAATLAGLVLLQERLQRRSVVGSLLVLAGSVLLSWVAQNGG